MPKATSRNWTQVAGSISYNNHNTTSTSDTIVYKDFYVYPDER